jgi:hypothetical protein
VASGTEVVERQRLIAAPPEPIIERIVDFRRWQAWSPWEDVDPNMQRTYAGAERGVGAVYAWAGNRKAGEGRMEIVAVDDTSVTIDLRFEKPFTSQNTTLFLLEPRDDGTNVTWRMQSPRTMLTRIMGLFTSMDKLIGPDFAKGLEQLQLDVERSTTA